MIPHIAPPVDKPTLYNLRSSRVRQPGKTAVVRASLVRNYWCIIPVQKFPVVYGRGIACRRRGQLSAARASRVTTSIRPANLTSGPPSRKPAKPSRRRRRASGIGCKTRPLVKIHPLAPVSIDVAAHCDTWGGHQAVPARARNIFARVLKRKQGQRLQLLRAHSHVFPAARPRNAKSITQSASFRRTPNS